MRVTLSRSGFREEEVERGCRIVVSLVERVACVRFAETHLDNLLHLVVNRYHLSHVSVIVYQCMYKI